MRILALLGPAAAPLAPVLVTKLAAIFERVARNPVNATYNHYMFECLGLLVRASCRGAEPAAADRACDLLESLLFPPFQRVLSEDISEFTPYVRTYMTTLSLLPSMDTI